MDYELSAQNQGDTVYFSIYWSPLKKADRWSIATSIPAVGGVFELYWKDDHQHLRLFTVGNARYGGLRSEIRRLTDSELAEEPKMAALLADKEIWYRYSISNSSNDMADVVWFFRKTYFPENPAVSHSGRYKKIYVKEISPDKVQWVP